MKNGILPAMMLLVGVGFATSASAVPIPIVYYDFQSGLTNKGSLGATDNAAASGGATGGTAGGINGNGLSLAQASSQYINSPITQAQTGANFTISAWFNLDTTPNITTARFYLFEGGDNFNVSFGTPGTPLIAKGATTATYVTYVQQNAAFTTGALTTTSTVGTTNWHNVVESFASNGTNTTLTTYIDGAAVSSFAPTTAVPQVTFSSGVNIGNARAGNPRPWSGGIDEFAVWNSALAQSDVNTIYNNGSPTELPLPTPEPGSLAILGLGAAGLLARRRAK